MNPFAFGKTSEANLTNGVHSDLVACARHALYVTRQEFMVFEGLRKPERQRLLFASGASQTLESYHLTGEAIDLVPIVAGRPQWQEPLCLRVALAMQAASIKLVVPIVWGGVWDRVLAALDPNDFEGEIEAYKARWRARHPDSKKRPFIDLPHFQRVRP